MSVKVKHTEYDCIYFITFSCYRWIPLFEITNLYEEILQWFRILMNMDLKINGYVIMPNHLHLLIYYPKLEKSINTIIGNGKRFLAYEIVKRLKIQANQKVLNCLQLGVTPREKSSGKLHKVFNPSFDAKVCESRDFADQKLDYIHYNPVTGKWKLVEDYTEYKYSSAQFYEFGKELDVAVTHYMEFV